MNYLFGDTAYPRITSPADILPSLRADHVRAVSLKDETLSADIALIRAGLTYNQNPHLARRYFHDPEEKDGRLITGKTEYLAPYTPQQIFEEALAADIEITPHALDTLTHHANTLRLLFEQFLQDQPELGHAPVVGRLLFAPKGAQGRSPKVHVDDVPYTMHTSFNMASLRLHHGTFSDQVWDAMDSKHKHDPDPEKKQARDAYLTHITEHSSEDFSNAPVGDILILKGQKNKDLSDPANRRSVAPHASSPFIAMQGQAALLFYPQIS